MFLHTRQKVGFFFISGRFDFVSVTAETLQGGLQVMRDSFFNDENVAIATEVCLNPAAKKELEELCVRAAKDGVSLVAVDKNNGKVAAVAFNKLQVKKFAGDDTYFENYLKNCKEDSSKALVQFMIDADAAYDLFEHCQADCLIEIMFLATLPEYRKMGLGLKLMETTIELAKELVNGNMVKVPLSGCPIQLQPVPTVVSAIFTTIVTQIMGEKIGFKKAIEISYNNFFYKGRTFASKIGPDTPFITLHCLKL